MPTPLFYDNHFFILSDLRKNLSKIVPESGSLVWRLDLPGKYKWRASPTAADDKIFLMNHNAEVLVVSSSSGEILNSAKMGEDTMIKPDHPLLYPKDSCLFVLTKLYCIE